LALAGQSPDIADIFVIGGGINACGIARNAAGRGLSVVLAEMNDLASATSSASTKLFHGGLRTHEYYQFGLVRAALNERETLLRAMPHISWPMRFVLPLHVAMRPAWLVRLGLCVYDHLGGRKILPGTRSLVLAQDPAGKALKPKFRKAFEYSDCRVQDARLVALDARVITRVKVELAERDGALWRIEVRHEDGAAETLRARALVNTGGPYVQDVIRDALHIAGPSRVRLVRASHIVMRRLFDHDRSYFFQGSDGRIIFAIPYETDFTLIGTTDQDHCGSPAEATCTDEEADYLCQFASEYLARPVTRNDIVWTYSGVRPLYDDGASSATAATRDYVLDLDTSASPPLLNIFGGKITTYRRLAGGALRRLAPFFPEARGPWTAGAPLPGGDFPVVGVPRADGGAHTEVSVPRRGLGRPTGSGLWDGRGHDAGRGGGARGSGRGPRRNADRVRGRLAHA
jgi:glycerol-3-phosphate dehydrogenase